MEVNQKVLSIFVFVTVSVAGAEHLFNGILELRFDPLHSKGRFLGGFQLDWDEQQLKGATEDPGKPWFRLGVLDSQVVEGLKSKSRLSSHFVTDLVLGLSGLLWCYSMGDWSWRLKTRFRFCWFQDQYWKFPLFTLISVLAPFLKGGVDLWDQFGLCLRTSRPHILVLLPHHF